jgi:hypothetical protein
MTFKIRVSSSTTMIFKDISLASAVDFQNPDAELKTEYAESAPMA